MEKGAFILILLLLYLSYVTGTSQVEGEGVVIVVDGREPLWVGFANSVSVLLGGARILNATPGEIVGSILSRAEFVIFIVHTTPSGLMVTSVIARSPPAAILPNGEIRVALHPKQIASLTPMVANRKYLLITCAYPGYRLIRALSRSGEVVFYTTIGVFPSPELERKVLRIVSR